MTAIKIRSRWCALSALAFASLSTGCGLETVGEFGGGDTGAEGAFPIPPDGSPGASPEVDATRELLVVDPAVLATDRGRSDIEGAPWSFRTMFEWLAGSPEDSSAFVRGWLEQWTTVTRVGPADAPVTPRPGVRDVLLDPWEKSSYGSSASPSLARAPFRLIAIVNRLDLAVDPCEPGGELRFVYTAVAPGADKPLDMTVIVELPYPMVKTPHAWAAAWHAAASKHGDEYIAAIDTLTTGVREHTDPANVRVRTNERALAPQAGWELREFHLAGSDLVQVSLDATPREDASASALAKDITAHESELSMARYTLPVQMRAGVASLRRPDFIWTIPEVPSDLARAFSAGTCNGCHGGNTEALPFQHIAPSSSPGEQARLSHFLKDPDADQGDDLSRRGAAYANLLNSSCSTNGVYP